MTDIQFYHLTSTPLERALPKLLEKCLQGGFTTRIKLESDEKAEWMNTLLWIYNPDSFLPHGTAKDGYSEAQPIYLTAGDDNANNADLLIVTDGSTVKPEPELKRMLDVFDGNDEAATAGARERWKHYQDQGHPVVYIKQTPSGSWEKQASS